MVNTHDTPSPVRDAQTLDTAIHGEHVGYMTVVEPIPRGAHLGGREGGGEGGGEGGMEGGREGREGERTHHGKINTDNLQW